MKKTRLILLGVAFAFHLLASNIFSKVPGVAAQSSNTLSGWSPSERIPGFANEAQTPYLVAGQDHTIHLFTHQPIGDDGHEIAIVYNQWSPQFGWSPPVDILLSPIKRQARMLGVYLDGTGKLHVIFFGGDDVEANIYYSQAPVDDAGNAAAWTTPRVIGERALTPENGAIIGDNNDNLVVVYSGNRSGHGLYATHSLDGGDNWSDPIPLYLTYNPMLWPFDLQSYVDSQNEIHLVWSDYNFSGLAETVHHAKLTEDLNEIGTRTEFGIGEQPSGYPSIIEYDNEFFLIHNDRSPSGLTRYMRRSIDGGDTWSEKNRLFQHIGSNGSASLVIDSNRVMHMFFANRINKDSGIMQGMWHSIWEFGQWSEPQAIVSGLQRLGFAPTRPRAIVSQGNLIFLTWMTDAGANRREFGGTYYATNLLDAPGLPFVSWPAREGFALASPQAEAAPTITLSTATPIPVDRTNETAAYDRVNNPLTSILLSIMPVILIISIVFFVKKFTVSKRI